MRRIVDLRVNGDHKNIADALQYVRDNCLLIHERNFGITIDSKDYVFSYDTPKDLFDLSGLGAIGNWFEMDGEFFFVNTNHRFDQLSQLRLDKYGEYPVLQHIDYLPSDLNKAAISNHHYEVLDVSKLINYPWSKSTNKAVRVLFLDKVDSSGPYSTDGKGIFRMLNNHAGRDQLIFTMDETPGYFHLVKIGKATAGGMCDFSLFYYDPSRSIDDSSMSIRTGVGRADAIRYADIDDVADESKEDPVYAFKRAMRGV